MGDRPNSKERARFEKYLLEHGINYRYTMSNGIRFEYDGTEYFVEEHLDGVRLMVFHSRMTAHEMINDIFGQKEG